MQLTLTLKGQPITKKNSQRIVRAGRRMMVVPSEQYRAYEDACLWQIPASVSNRIETPVNVKAVYYMPTHRQVDLVNLLEATMDILVAAQVLADDNSNIAVAHDGSRVLYDKHDPRVEITITDMEANA